MLHSGLLDQQSFILALLTKIDLFLQDYVYNGYNALSGYLKIPLGLISTIYIVLLGYGAMHGWVKLSMSNLLKIVFKIALIYTAVTQWGFVSEYFIGFINSAIGELGDTMIAASPIHIPGISGMDGALQLTLNEFTTLASKVFGTGGLLNFSGWFDGVTLTVFGYFIVGIGVFEIILAKVMLAILFVFTPLIVIFCYFKPFRAIFDRWLGAIVGFALLQLFVTAALAMSLSLAYWWLGFHIGQSVLKMGSVSIWPIIIVGIVCIGITLKAASLAQNLGGVVSTYSGTAMIGGMLGGAIGSTTSGMGVIKKTISMSTKTMGIGAGIAKFTGGTIYSGISNHVKGVDASVRSHTGGDN